MAKVVEFIKDKTVAGVGCKKVGDTLKVCDALFDTLVSEGVAKEYVEEAPKKKNKKDREL
jgi:hypothetical protein